MNVFKSLINKVMAKKAKIEDTIIEDTVLDETLDEAPMTDKEILAVVIENVLESNNPFKNKIANLLKEAANKLD